MISRPFALVGFSFTAALIALNLFEGAQYTLIPFALGSLVVCAFLKRMLRREAVAVAMLSVIFAVAVFLWRENFLYQPSMALAQDGAEVVAKIVSLPQAQSSGIQYILEVEQINSVAFSGRIMLLSELPLDAQPYDTIRFTADLSSVSTAGDFENYYKARDVFWRCYELSDYDVTECSLRPVGYYFLKAKEYMLFRINSLMSGDEAALAVGMLTGDTSALSNYAYASFRSTGIVHVLSVSGMHMSVIVLSLYSLLHDISRRYLRLWALGCCFVAVAYAGISGFSHSVVRSCIMVCIMLSGKIISKRADTLNSLGLAAFIITVINPYAAVDWSFMLSFASTLGIVLLANFTNSFGRRACRKIKPAFLNRLCLNAINIAGISVAANLFCLPIMVFFVGYASLIFLPANLLTAYAVSAVLILSLVCVAPLGPFSEMLAGVCTLLCRYVLRVIEWLAEFEFAGVSVDNGFSKIIMAVLLAFAAIAVLTVHNKNRLLKCLIIGCCAACSAIFCFSLVLEKDRTDIFASSNYTVIAMDNEAVVIGLDENSLFDVSQTLADNGIDTVSLVLPLIEADDTMRNARPFFSSYEVERLILKNKNEICAYAKSYEISGSSSFTLGKTKFVFSENSYLIASSAGSTAILAGKDKNNYTNYDYTIDLNSLEGEERALSYNAFGEIKGGEGFGTLN